MIFQKDYWKMSNEKLEKEANKHGIGAWEEDSYGGHLDRNHAIERLLVRDQAMQTRINVVATFISIASVVINVALLFLRHR